MPPDYQPDEEDCADVWLRMSTGPHRDHGGWWRDQGGQPVCACGTVLAAPEGEAAA